METLKLELTISEYNTLGFTADRYQYATELYDSMDHVGYRTRDASYLNSDLSLADSEAFDHHFWHGLNWSGRPVMRVYEVPRTAVIASMEATDQGMALIAGELLKKVKRVYDHITRDCLGYVGIDVTVF